MKNIDELAIFCNNVKLLRKQNGISKKQMAKIMGVGVGSLTKIENGEIPERMSISPIFDLATYFCMKPYELFIAKK